MDEKIVRLSFLKPVHFGAGRLSDNGFTFDAATFFSALYIEAIRLGCASELLAAAREGDLTLSDAFPYMGDTLYLPKPMVRPSKRRVANDSRARKAAKKLDYIPVDRLGDYLAGSLDPVKECKRFDVGTSGVHTKVNLTYEHKDDAEPYHVGSFSFKSNAGVYVVVRGGYDLKELLGSLQYSGIGGRRSSGFGRFEFQIDTFNLVTHAGALNSDVSGAGVSKQLLLSTAMPTQAELGDDLLVGARYKLVRRGGFVQSTAHNAMPQKKRDLYLFAAGSVFMRTFTGDVFDVNATDGAHPVYRYARAMWMEV